MVALGVILHRLEALLPLPTPWVKLGLANLMTLMALGLFGDQRGFYRNPAPGHTGFHSWGNIFRPYLFPQPGGRPCWYRNHVRSLQQGKGAVQPCWRQCLWSLYPYFHYRSLRLLFSYKANFLFRPASIFLLTGPDYRHFDRSGRQSFIPANGVSAKAFPSQLKVL